LYDTKVFSEKLLTYKKLLTLVTKADILWVSLERGFSVKKMKASRSQSKPPCGRPSFERQLRLAVIQRAYKTELDPTVRQRALFSKGAGVSRFAWNWGLARRIEEYKLTGKSSSAFTQSVQLNALKREQYPWMLDVSKWVLQSALADLDNAYQHFFRRAKAKQGKPGFPKFKAKHRSKSSFRVRARISIESRRVYLPRIGRVRLKRADYLPSDVKINSATISETAGRWFVSLQVEEQIPAPRHNGRGVVGVDLCIKTLAVCSDGRTFENPRALPKAQHKLARLQREMSRREKGSKKRVRSRRKVARLHYRISCLRKDALHKATSSIVLAKTKPAVIVLEDLNVKGMVKNHCLARSVSDAAFAEFRRQCEYKCAWYGVTLILAPRFFPSSKTCHVCGIIKEDLTLADREWTCECGARHDRDLNAAKNLKQYGWVARNQRSRRLRKTSLYSGGVVERRTA